MIELYRWLGDLNGIDALCLFEINPHDYYHKDSDREIETKRLESALKTSYRKLMLKLHRDKLQQFPESFQQLSEEYFKEVKTLYGLLTDKEKYKNPNPDEGRHNLPGVVSATLETFTLTNYVVSLQLNQPDELPLVGTIKKFIQARDDLEQLLLRLHRKGRESPVPFLPPQTPISETEYQQMIDERDSIIRTKETEIEQLQQEKKRIEDLQKATRQLLDSTMQERRLLAEYLDSI